jgi:magnesium transporter
MHQIREEIRADGFVWIDLETPDDDALQELAKHIKLHPLTIQDAKMFRQRPKIEDYDDYMYLVVFGVDPGTASGGPLLREVHIIITGEAVVTIHRRPNDALADLRQHYDDQHIRSEQFLVYKILDAITTTFIPVLTRIDDDIDDIEEQVIESTSSVQLERIFSIRRDLVAMRRVITPMRDMFQRSGDRIASLPGLQTDDKLYFRDLYDGLIRTSELIDSYRDLLSGATDMYLSQVANKQGEINKQLTVIATIFLPLTFLTGFFGMNFTFLTDRVINQEWTFWVLGVGLLVISVAGLAIWFKRKRWF